MWLVLPNLTRYYFITKFKPCTLFFFLTNINFSQRVSHFALQTSFNITWIDLFIR